MERKSPTSELIISRSLSSRAFCVNTRIPREHTFAVVVRSDVDGSYKLEICTGKDN